MAEKKAAKRAKPRVDMGVYAQAKKLRKAVEKQIAANHGRVGKVELDAILLYRGILGDP